MMAPLLDQVLKSPRARVLLGQLSQHLEQEQAARQRFRDSMNEDTRAEFINGEVFMHSPAKLRHNRTAQRIYKIVDAYVERHRLGMVGHEKHLVELTRNDVEPDVSFWNRGKSSKFVEDQLLFPPPDLAVEVLSESTERNDRGTKFEDYAVHGVTEYWIVDPENRVLEQYVLKDDSYDLRQKSGNGTVRCIAIEGGEFPIEAFFDDEANQKALAAIR